MILPKKTACKFRLFLIVAILGLVLFFTAQKTTRAEMDSPMQFQGMQIIREVEPVTHHPDTEKDLSNFEVPDWPTFLELASHCADITGLGYLGVDIVLDRNRGPMILELNARPGLAIQVANGQGLWPRVDLIEKETAGGGDRTPAERTAFAMEAFTNN